jgi:hypothetical protein
MFRSLPAFGGDQRAVAEVVRGIMDGKTNNTGTITLATGGATTTTLVDRRIGPDSVILFAPETFEASRSIVPRGAFQNDADQTFGAVNTPTVVAFSTVDSAYGFSLASNKVTIVNAGTYNIQFSLQFANMDSQIHEVIVWLRKNGTDIVGTGSKYAVVNSHGSVDGYLIAVANFFIDVAANDYIELVCSTTSTQVYLERYTASTSPYTRPSIPSSVITFTLVSPLPEMYVSSQGQGTATISHLANSTAGKTYKYAVIG